jgi:LysR family glycine cleavage system transcriptional activator
LQAAEDELGIAMISKIAAEAALRKGSVIALTQIPTVPLPQKWLTKSNLLPRTPAVEIVFEWLRLSEQHGVQ